MHRVLCAVAALIPLVAQAAPEAPEGAPAITAARAEGAIRVDGRIDEPAWAAAPVFDRFVQRFPDVGAAPTERTELRVLYDARFLYVSVICHDSAPDQISRQLGRRDSDPASDNVQVLIDAMHDHRTAYQFSINAGGVLSDGLWFGDHRYTSDWDGVWEGAAVSLPDGWAAELAIPLSQLQFSTAPKQTWGFSVRRNILRKHEEIETVLNPRSSNAVVSRLGLLTGMEGLRPQAVNLLPYLAARAVLRPQFATDLLESPLVSPRLLDPTIDVGLDFKSALSSDLTLVGTLNPDFGQVEADQIILNLSVFETFFPEKRPFFLEGMEMFQPVGGGPGDVPFAMFYSRRIGLDGAPIFGAAKMTGAVGSVQVALLDAVTAGPAVQTIDENAPDGRYEFHPEQPLHLAPTSSLAIVAPPPTNFLAGVARMKVSQSSRIGLTVTSAVPVAPTCTFDQFVQPPLTERPAFDSGGNPIASRVYDRARPSSCYGRTGHAVGMDFDLNTDDAVYSAYGQVAGSVVGRGIEESILRDGTPLREGDLGLGAYAKVAKVGGSGLRWDLNYEYASPKLELNPVGFLRTQNYHQPWATLEYRRQDGWGPLKDFDASLSTGYRWSSDGRNLPRGGYVVAAVSAVLPSFDSLGVQLLLEGGGGYNPREIVRSGVPIQLQDKETLGAFWGSNKNRVLSTDGYFNLVHRNQAGATPDSLGWSGGLNFNFRPHPVAETRLEVGTDHSPMAARFIGWAFDPSAPGAPPIDSDTFFFGDLESNFLSFTLRQSVVFAPKLTAQVYAQLFTDYGAFGAFYQAAPDAALSPIPFSALAPLAKADDRSFYGTQLNLNVVLRWEYRLGSTIYAVYTRQQAGASQPGGAAAPRTVLPMSLFGGPAADSFMVKWSYFWSP